MVLHVSVYGFSKMASVYFFVVILIHEVHSVAIEVINVQP